MATRVARPWQSEYGHARAMLNAREPGRMMLPLSHQSENAFGIFGAAKEVPTMAVIKEFTVLMENRSLAFPMVAGSKRSLRLLGATPPRRVYFWR